MYEWYNGAWFGLRALRTPDLKFVWYPGDNRDELYDLKKDPGELTNLIKNSDYKQKLAHITSLLEREMARVDDPMLDVYQHHLKSILLQEKEASW